MTTTTSSKEAHFTSLPMKDLHFVSNNRNKYINLFKSQATPSNKKEGAL